MSFIKNVEHVVFDFDGVIVDSEKKKFADLQEILKDDSYTLFDSEFSNFIGKKRGSFLQDIGISNTEEIMKKVHEKDLNYDFRLIEGFLEFLKLLQQKNIKMHIATGSSRKFVLSLLQKHNISQYFSEILTGDEVKESKPNPKIYLEMKNRLQSENIIVIEDSPAGVTAAKSAGLFVIGLGKNLAADIEFTGYAEIIEYISKSYSLYQQR